MLTSADDPQVAPAKELGETMNRFKGVAFTHVFVLLLVLILAACGGSGSTNDTSGGDSGSTAESATPGDDTVMTDDFDSPEMAALMPTSVDGVAFTVSSFDYSKIPLAQAAMSFQGGDIEGWLGQTGKTWADVRWVMANTDMGGSKTATVTALRVVGADEAAMLEWFGLSGMSMGGDESTVSIGGKSVYKLAIPGLTSAFYYWVSGDTLYYATADPVEFGDMVVAATK